MIEVKIRFHDWKKSESWRVWQFSLAVWHRFRERKELQISVEEADQAYEEYRFFVRRRHLRRALKELEDVIEEHKIGAELDVLVLDPTKKV